MRRGDAEKISRELYRNLAGWKMARPKRLMYRGETGGRVGEQGGDIGRRRREENNLFCHKHTTHKKNGTALMNNIFKS